MVFNHEKEKMLKLLDRGSDVTIIQHGLSASLWTQRIKPVFELGADIKVIAATFGVPERLVDDFTVGYPYSGA